METTFEVVEQSQVAQVRRLAMEIGRAHDLSEEDIGRAAIVATEAATNLVKYGERGTVTLSPFFDEGSVGVQMIVMDHGPGFPDFSGAVRDGFSTGGSLGLGLGSMMRASDLFEAYAGPQQGTAFLARVARGRTRPGAADHRLAVGARRAAMRGETECGDAWGHARCGRWDRLCLVDGLGHGPMAAIAAQQAVAVFRAAGESATPADIVQQCHEAIGATRGAVMGVAAIDADGGRVLFAGVGNIAGMVYSATDSHHLLSTEGIVGHNMRKVRVVERPWSRGDSIVLSTDGLSGRWNLARYPGLVHRHALLVASVLFRDFARNTDDATVIVAKGLK
ncbi:MAG TPA: SpoIIE family protein phosphatase [Ramlibacter sp.]|nr:SpoIIE family protein phosphatase [Ramlibacter sp.]